MPSCTIGTVGQGAEPSRARRPGRVAVRSLRHRRPEPANRAANEAAPCFSQSSSATRACMSEVNRVSGTHRVGGHRSFRRRHSASACRVRYSANQPGFDQQPSPRMLLVSSVPLSLTIILGLRRSGRVPAQPGLRRARYWRPRPGAPECSRRRSPGYESVGRRPVDWRRNRVTSDRQGILGTAMGAPVPSSSVLTPGESRWRRRSARPPVWMTQEPNRGQFSFIVASRGRWRDCGESMFPSIVHQLYR